MQNFQHPQPLPFLPGPGLFKSFLLTQVDVKVWALETNTGRGTLLQVLPSSLTIGCWNTVLLDARDRDCKLAQARYLKEEAVRLLNRHHRRFLCSSYKHSTRRSGG